MLPENTPATAEAAATPLPRCPLRVSFVHWESVTALVGIDLLALVPVVVALVDVRFRGTVSTRIAAGTLLAALILAGPLCAWAMPWLCIDPAGNRVRVYKWWPFGKVDVELSNFHFVIIDAIYPLGTSQTFRVGLGGSGTSLWVWKLAPSYLLARRLADSISKTLRWEIHNTAWRAPIEHFPARTLLKTNAPIQRGSPAHGNQPDQRDSPSSDYLELINEPPKLIRLLPWIPNLVMAVVVVVLFAGPAWKLFLEYRKPSSIYGLSSPSPSLFELGSRVAIVLTMWALFVGQALWTRLAFSRSGLFRDSRRGTVSVWNIVRYRPWFGRRPLAEFRMVLLTSAQRRFLFWRWQ